MKGLMGMSKIVETEYNYEVYNHGFLDYSFAKLGEASRFMDDDFYRKQYNNLIGSGKMSTYDNFSVTVVLNIYFDEKEKERSNFDLRKPMLPQLHIDFDNDSREFIVETF